MNVARALKQAIRQAQGGHPAQARDTCGAVLRHAPRDAEAQHLMGLFCKDSGDLLRAERHLRRAIALGDRGGRSLAALGGVLAIAGRLEEAAGCLERSLVLSPERPAVLADLARTWQRLGRLDRAVEGWRAALALVPGALSARFGLGTALLEAGDYSAAIGCFERVLAARPGHVDSLNNLASAQAALGALDAAEATLRRGIALAPKAARLHTNLGAVLATRGCIEAPITCYERALAIDPDFLSAAVKLGKHLVEIGHYEVAELRFRQVLSSAPRDAEAVAGLASALERRGQVEAAGALIEAHMDLVPGSASLIATAATLWRRSAPERAAALVDARLSGPMPVAQRALLLRHRGHLRDAGGDPAGAFAAWAEANALRGEAWDHAAWWAEVDATRARFTAQAFAAMPRAAEHSALPVLIVGVPRSGTSLVEQIVASHPAVHGAGELELLRVMAASAGAQTGQPWPAAAAALTAAQVDVLGATYRQRLQIRNPQAARITDKMPQNFRWLGLAGLALPGARVIHCRRAPAEVALSCFRQGFSANFAWSNSLEDLAVYYRGYELLMARWLQLGALPTLTVDYEALVSNPEAVIPALIDFCGLDWDARCLRPHENQRTVNTASYAQVRRPIYTSSLHRSAPYVEQLRPFEQALAALRATRG